MDECLDNNGDCEHQCENVPGSYKCVCNDSYKLSGDNRTCTPEGGVDQVQDQQAARRGHCYANCDTVSRLHDRLRALQEKVRRYLVLLLS